MAEVIPRLRNALSNYGQWSEAHPWTSAAAGFVPIVGQAQGVADTASALNRGAYGEAGLNALLTAFPFGRAANVVKNKLGIVAGEKAATANKATLGKAKELMASGADRDAIHSQTGWWQGPDGKWRVEIDDSTSSMKQSPQSFYDAETAKYGHQTHETTLPNMLEHKGLVDAYPEMGRARLFAGDQTQGARGSYMGRDYDGNHLIGIDPADGKSTLLHESQHAIQETEGFQTGGNPGEFIAGYRSILRDYNDQIDSINSKLKGASGTPRYEELLELRSYLVKELQKIEGPHGIGAQEKGFDNYRRLAGEAEARAVQARMNLSPEQRAQRPFWQDFDVPESEQIIR